MPCWEVFCSPIPAHGSQTTSLSCSALRHVGWSCCAVLTVLGDTSGSHLCSFTLRCLFRAGCCLHAGDAGLGEAVLLV